MIPKETVLKLHSNQRLFVEELLRRGVEVELLVEELELLEAKFDDHVELILDRDASATPYASCVACSDKYLTKKLLKRAGLSVPEGEQFFPDQKDDALSYGKQLRYPLVLKPSNGSHGDNCFMDIDSCPSLEDAIDQFAADVGSTVPFLIEKQCPGMEFRIFITKTGDYAVLHRDPAFVIGDGTSTISQLALRETNRRMNPRTNCLCPIVIDKTVRACLSRSGLSLDSVPAAGLKIYLRRNSNIAQGGQCEDYSSRAHSSLIDIARRALKAIPGLPLAGVDVLSTDVSAPQEKGTYAILEVNSNPGIHMHMRPGIGAGRNVASYLADLVFPETSAASKTSSHLYRIDSRHSPTGGRQNDT